MIQKLLLLLVLSSSCSAMQRSLTHAERLSDLKIMLPKQTNPAEKAKIELEIKRYEYLINIYLHLPPEDYAHMSRDHYLHEGLFGDDY